MVCFSKCFDVHQASDISSHKEATRPIHSVNDHSRARPPINEERAKTSKFCENFATCLVGPDLISKSKADYHTTLEWVVMCHCTTSAPVIFCNPNSNYPLG